MAEKLSWLRQFPRLAGTIVGIILTAIGGVMTINVVLKVYVFDFDTPRYFNPYDQCKLQDYAEVKDGEKPRKLTAEEKEVCIEEKTVVEKARYLRDKKESLIDGAAMLIVGIPFWLIFTRKKKSPSKNSEQTVEK